MKRIIILLIIILPLMFISFHIIDNDHRILFSAKGDLDSDGKQDIVLIERKGRRKYLKADMGSGTKTVEITRLKPRELKICNIDGGVPEIFISTEKSTMLHPEVIERPFFLNIIDGRFVRKWTGSTFGHRYRKVYFLDTCSDNREKVFTVCREGKKELIRAYYWMNFGFIYIGESRAYDSVNNLYMDKGNICADVVKNGKNMTVRLKPDFSYSKDNLKLKEVN